MEPFQSTNSPVAATTTATSHDRVAFGLFLPCPGSHGYCISCLSTYITSKLDPDEDGGGRMDIVVFPLLCPECSSQEWPQGIEDGVAKRVLSEKAMELWVSHRDQIFDIVILYFSDHHALAPSKTARFSTSLFLSQSTLLRSRRSRRKSRRSSGRVSCLPPIALYTVSIIMA